MIAPKYSNCVLLVCLLLLGLLVIGCGPGTAPEPVPPSGGQALNLAKTTLQSYINGEQRGSEVESYEWMVENVRQSDPAKADILQKGFDELKRCSNSSLKSAAQKILDQL